MHQPQVDARDMAACSTLFPEQTERRAQKTPSLDSAVGGRIPDRNVPEKSNDKSDRIDEVVVPMDELEKRILRMSQPPNLL